MNTIKLNSIKSAVKNIQNKKVGFEVNPLDIGLAEIQMNLIKRLEREIPEHGDFATVVEKFELKNPMLDISNIEVVCKFLNKDVPKKTQRTLEINVTDKSGINTFNYVIANGDKSEILNAVHQKDFFRICKSVAMNVDEGVK